MGAQCSECVARQSIEETVETHMAFRTTDGRRQLLECHAGEHPSEGYDVSEVIGEGSFSDVRRLVSKKTKALGALKTISKDRTQEDILKRELEISLSLDHPHVVRLFDVYEDWQNVYMVFEYCGGGEVMDKLLDKEQLSESETLLLLGQALHAINYIHAKQVAHRDIKLENLLLKDDVDDLSQANLKIIDFGMARRFVAGQSTLTTVVGSAYYIAPEVLKESGGYGEKCDIWSMGVVAYMLIGAGPPFAGDTQDEILESVLGSSVSFRGSRWRSVSKETKALVKSMLKRSVPSRPDAKGALAQWKTVACEESSRYSDASPKPTASDGVSTSGDESQSPLMRPPDSFHRLKAFGMKSRFVKSARHLIARHLEPAQLNNLQLVFHKLDVDGDGTLTLGEVRKGFAAAGYEAGEIEEAFAHVDTDSSDLIEYTEFIAALMDKANCLREELCWEAFRVFDTDHDGHIGIDDLRKALQIMDKTLPHLSTKEAEDLIREHDKDGDNQISFQEFVAMMQTTTAEAPGEGARVPLCLAARRAAAG